ncbi:LacI family DNA-binding transcriptional regulator [Pelagicoccus enzymogenes]|uniref:LacI family DNA-binding transcriptional regulator n=1 Tax=Pelagicoccus enzymogenes TaxID=2773457 RepID=UPI00280FB0D0|nr:LacI family DNA-binding transcriptional regulator [Pelagicoccus enzymogenes]MDQ8198598.1 LacI family DNA-binding transcriptional regulator [Pelagicoccus enzymogenes]
MEPANSRVNQAEIARALGLSQSTVSIALKGDTRVAKKTREAIKKKAEELGYVPDPNLFALSLYRTQSKADKIVAGMAWVTNFPTKDGWKDMRMIRDYRKGAEEQARKMGYQLYDFWLGDPEVSSQRFRQILLARGIRGLIFAPQAEFHTTIDLDFSDFAAVTLGYTLWKPELHLVSNHQHRTIRLAYRSLQNLGYQKIGMVMNSWVDRRVAGSFTGGFLSLNPTLKGKGFVAPHLYEDFDSAAFEKWFNKWKPDALISSGDCSKNVKEWAKNKGLVLGKDFAFAELNLMDLDGSIAGVSQRGELIGKSAASVVDSLLNHFEYGIPAAPLRTLVEGVWVDGATAPRKGVKST